MRKLFALGVCAASVFALGSAHADPAYFSGRIQIGNPAAAGIAPGIVEGAAPCDPSDSINGLDGVWLDLAGNDGRTAVIAGNPLADFDVRFYSLADGVCTLLDGDMAAESIGEPEVGVVPDGAAFALVQLYLGYDAPFTLVIS
ncbi:MAG: hypothetical protein ABR548_01165 [Actinomycetota bacterium]